MYKRQVTKSGNSKVNTCLKQSLDLDLSLSELPESNNIALELQRKLFEHVKEYHRNISQKNENYKDVLGILLSQKVYTSRMQIQRTSEGQQFKWHTDLADDAIGKRLFAFIIYLNDVDVDFRGGYTDFLCTRIKPEAGKLLMFPADLFTHRGTVVESGMKYIISSFLFIKNKETLGNPNP